VGLERVTGRVHGRFGSFVLWHNAAAQASCAACAARRGSAWSPEADTLLRSTTTSSNESTLTEAFVGHRRTTAL
jgi:hypothetical protein